MINKGIVRTTENASSTQNLIKSEQKVPRPKAKALGDVQNTLHSRPGNFANPITNSAMKTPAKFHNHLKSATDENCFPNSASKKKVNVTPSKSAVELLLTPIAEEDVFEFHDHKLCEEDYQSYKEDWFSEFKLSEEDISNVVRSWGIPFIPLSLPHEPCPDIELPSVMKHEDSFSINDILNEIQNDILSYNPYVPAIP